MNKSIMNNLVLNSVSDVILSWFKFHFRTLISIIWNNPTLKFTKQLRSPEYIYLPTILACYEAVGLIIQKPLLKRSIFSLNEQIAVREKCISAWFDSGCISHSGYHKNRDRGTRMMWESALDCNSYRNCGETLTLCMPPMIWMSSPVQTYLLQPRQFRLSSDGLSFFIPCSLFFFILIFSSTIACIWYSVIWWRKKKTASLITGLSKVHVNSRHDREGHIVYFFLYCR